MCLYQDYDDDTTPLGDGMRTARIRHRCDECRRDIAPGERYRWWSYVDHYDERVETSKMCAHCWATVDVGASITGCPRFFYWGTVHSLDEEEGFVGNVLHDDGHALSDAERFVMLRTVAGRRRKWRHRDGSLMPVPVTPEPAARVVEAA